MLVPKEVCGLTSEPVLWPLPAPPFFVRLFERLASLFVCRVTYNSFSFYLFVLAAFVPLREELFFFYIVLISVVRSTFSLRRSSSCFFFWICGFSLSLHFNPGRPTTASIPSPSWLWFVLPFSSVLFPLEPVRLSRGEHVCLRVSPTINNFFSDVPYFTVFCFYWTQVAGFWGPSFETDPGPCSNVFLLLLFNEGPSDSPFVFIQVSAGPPAPLRWRVSFPLSTESLILSFSNLHPDSRRGLCCFPLPRTLLGF